MVIDITAREFRICFYELYRGRKKDNNFTHMSVQNLIDKTPEREMKLVPKTVRDIATKLAGI